MADRLATRDMDRNLGTVPPYLGGEMGPHHNVAWDEAYLWPTITYELELELVQLELVQLELELELELSRIFDI